MTDVLGLPPVEDEAQSSVDASTFGDGPVEGPPSAAEAAMVDPSSRPAFRPCCTLSIFA